MTSRGLVYVILKQIVENTSPLFDFKLNFFGGRGLFAGPLLLPRKRTCGLITAFPP